MISRPCEGHTRGCDITHHTKSRPKSVISQVCAICDANEGLMNDRSKIISVGDMGYMHTNRSAA